MELLFELLIVEFIAPIVIDFLAEIGITSLRGALKRTNNPIGFVDIASCGALGLMAGFISYLIVPIPVARKLLFPGSSLLLLPIAVGLLMHVWGKYRRGKGKAASALSTVWGGALFGFGYAAVRFVVFNILK